MPPGLNLARKMLGGEVRTAFWRHDCAWIANRHTDHLGGLAMISMRDRVGVLAVVIGAAALTGPARAATRLYVYNDTTSTDFPELYLAPAGTSSWGPNQTLSDRDKILDHSERLTLKDVEPGVYDMKLVDTKGRACVVRGVDLTTKRNFDIRDQTLSQCSR